MKAERERDIQRVCLDWLRAWGAVAIRINSGGRKVGDRFFRFNDEPGCSDSLVCLPGGRFAAIEYKRPGQKTTPAQESFLDAVRERGGLDLVVTSLDDLRTQLKAVGYDVEMQ